MAKKNLYKEVLSEEDAKAIEEIAKKYKFGKSLIVAYCKKENPRRSYKVSEEIKLKATEEARKNDMSISTYIVKLLEKVITDKKYVKYDFLKMYSRGGSGAGRESLGITFPNDGELIDTISSICSEYQVEECRFIRYVIENESL